jgi:non-ribosomal peptide synthetase component F
MTGASMFWYDTLYNYKFDRSLLLPFDRYRLADENQTGRGVSVSCHFDEHISHHLLAYVSSNDITPMHVASACYYALLFKLTNGENDLCVGMSTQSRYKKELMSIIGAFVNIIPLRCQFDSYWSFHQLTKHTREIITSSMKYSYFPLQHILSQHNNISKPTFFDAFFVFHSIENKNNKADVTIGNCQLHTISSSSIKVCEDEIMSEFDFCFTIQHDVNTNQLSCTIDGSLDLFYPNTVHKIAQRFHSILEQIFLFTDDQINKPICELSLILSDEQILMKSMNNTQVSFPSVNCIHHTFICQATKYSQKLAVELDEQSLTYSELLYYVQRLSLHILINYRIIPGDIVCQCVERSLSMVS